MAQNRRALPLTKRGWGRGLPERPGGAAQKVRMASTAATSTTAQNTVRTIRPCEENRRPL